MDLVRRRRYKCPDRARHDTHEPSNEGSPKDPLSREAQHGAICYLTHLGDAEYREHDLELGEPEHQEHYGDKDQSHAGQPLRPLAHFLAQPAAEPESDLRG